MMYTFLGIIGISQWETAQAHEKILVGYIYAASWMMILAGFLYFASGLFCCQKVRESVVSDYKKREEHISYLKSNVDVEKSNIMLKKSNVV